MLDEKVWLTVYALIHANDVLLGKTHIFLIQGFCARMSWLFLALLKLVYFIKLQWKLFFLHHTSRVITEWMIILAEKTIVCVGSSMSFWTLLKKDNKNEYLNSSFMSMHGLKI